LFGLLFERSYLNSAAFLHAISRADVEGAMSYGVRNRYVTAPNCIDPNLLPAQVHHDFIRERIPAARGRRTFVYIGRLDPDQKGLDTLLFAWSRVALKDRSALILVGPDWRRGRTRMQALARELGVSESVWFLDAVSGAEKWDLLSGTDVFVHPSRWEAGVPFSVLEAMLMGKPVLLTPPVDPDGAVASAGAGVIAPPDVEGIRRALGELADADESRLHDLGLAAATLVQSTFRWERTAQILLDGYADAVTRH
jgi:glycosyltransferase involved in cell wall biosynthesis